MKKSKIRVLCVCAAGINRSKYLAEYLRRKGYSTRFGGVEYKGERNFKALKQEDVDWADIIILARKRLEPILKRKVKIKNKKLILLNVTDSKRLIPDKLAHLRKLPYIEFQKKWTRPQLRKAIKEYLPMKL
jgi:predicted protein tyrosine phosphatase